MARHLTDSWWRFGHDSKIDVLKEPNHTHLVIRALGDSETGIDPHPDGTFTLYGSQEALLVIPQFLTTKLMLLFYSMIRQPAYAM